MLCGGTNAAIVADENVQTICDNVSGDIYLFRGRAYLILILKFEQWVWRVSATGTVSQAVSSAWHS